MAVRVLVLILGLALVQTVSAQDLKEGDKVQTPHFTGSVTEVINKGELNEEVRVQSNEEISTSAIYSSEQVQKIEGGKKLTARERRLQKAQQADWNFTGISLPGVGFRMGLGGFGVGAYVGGR